MEELRFKPRSVQLQNLNYFLCSVVGFDKFSSGHVESHTCRIYWWKCPKGGEYLKLGWEELVINVVTEA